MNIGDVQTMTMRDFFQQVETQGGTYEIDTPSGFQPIGDLYLKKQKPCLKVSTENSSLVCSKDHLLVVNDNWKFTKDIKVNDDVLLKEKVSKLINIEEAPIQDTYDLEVLHPSHTYYANDFVSHNSGKSTILSKVTDATALPDCDIAYAAFTGKAALVMRRYGMPATTIHSLIYEPVEQSDGTIVFELRKFLKEKPRLLVIDEASMVSDKLLKDLQSFGIPILCTGDHCQLPPVGDDIQLMIGADYVMDEPHPGAGKIAQLAHVVRHIGIIPPEFMHKGDDPDLLKWSKIMVGTNATRNAVNGLIRQLQGHSEWWPRVNEKVVVLRNTKEHANGQILVVVKTGKLNHKKKIAHLECVDEYEIDDAFALASGDTFENTYDFGWEEREKAEAEKKAADKKAKTEAYKSKTPAERVAEALAHKASFFHEIKKANLFKDVRVDYAYAITVHKAQGSRWPSVLVINDWPSRDEDMRRRWLYTAVTRAENEVAVCKL